MTIENGTPVLAVNPQRFAAFSPPEQTALLEHLVKHLLHLHMVRRKERHARDWDIACDLAINGGIENLPPQAACPEKLHLPAELAAEEYYAPAGAPLRHRQPGRAGIRQRRPRCRRTSAGRGGGRRQRPPAARAPLDDHAIWQEAQSTPLRLAEEVVRSLTRDAVRQSHGEIPGDVRTLVEGWLAPAAIPWRQVLRQFVATAGRVGRQSTWKREHRRFAHDTPGLRKRRRLHLLIGVDVSDSTNVRQLREAFAAELLRIARGRDSRLTVLYAGSRIQKIDSFRSSEVGRRGLRRGRFHRSAPGLRLRQNAAAAPGRRDLPDRRHRPGAGADGVADALGADEGGGKAGGVGGGVATRGLNG